jgi:uncharacterized membrane protein YbhN (UPF0104 family)
MNEKTKKILNTILKLTISSGLIIYLFTNKIDTSELAKNFKLMDWRFLPLILLTIIANYVIGAFRWKALLIQEGTEKVSRIYLIKLYFIGAFFNNFMPTSIGGDVYKMYALGKKIDNQAVGFSSTFTERFTGILMLGLIGLLSMSRNLGLGVFIILLWVISGFYIGMTVLKVLSKKIKFLKKIYDALMVYKDHPKVLLYAFFTSILIQICAISTQYLIFFAVGIRLPIFYSLMAFPIITLAGFFIPSINGIGVQDALYASMFSFVGVSAGTAISVSIIYHMIRMSVSLIGGLIYALGKD